MYAGISPLMGCTALDPNLTPRDQALFLNDHMPVGLRRCGCR
jgi:hypothetical protein